MTLCEYILTSGKYRNEKCHKKIEFSNTYCDEHLIILGKRYSLVCEKDILRYNCLIAEKKKLSLRF